MRIPIDDTNSKMKRSVRGNDKTLTVCHYNSYLLIFLQFDYLQLQLAQQNIAFRLFGVLGIDNTLAFSVKLYAPLFNIHTNDDHVVVSFQIFGVTATYIVIMIQFYL